LITVDLMVVICGAVAALQRPYADLPVALAAFAITVSPIASFDLFSVKFSPALLGVTWLTAAAMLLFGTSTPIHGDFAPSLLVLMIATVGWLTTPVGGFLAFLSGFAVLLAASALNRLDAPLPYLGLLAAGWMIGYLVYAQRLLVAEQIPARGASTGGAPAGEPRRAASEAHDGIAHPPSTSLPGPTRARPSLIKPADTAGLPKHSAGKIVRIAPEPGIDDIAALVKDFERSGLAITLSIDGSSRHVTPAVSLALYRLACQSVANVAKYAPYSESIVALIISAASAQITVYNEPAAPIVDRDYCTEYGLSEMRWQIKSLGGAIEYGPTDDGWSVCAEIPLQECSSDWSPWWCA
jgi:hypothetical protein